MYNSFKGYTFEGVFCLNNVSLSLTLFVRSPKCLLLFSSNLDVGVFELFQTKVGFARCILKTKQNIVYQSWKGNAAQCPVLSCRLLIDCFCSSFLFPSHSMSSTTNCCCFVAFYRPLFSPAAAWLAGGYTFLLSASVWSEEECSRSGLQEHSVSSSLCRVSVATNGALSRRSSIRANTHAPDCARCVYVVSLALVSLIMLTGDHVCQLSPLLLATTTTTTMMVMMMMEVTTSELKCSTSLPSPPLPPISAFDQIDKGQQWSTDLYCCSREDILFARISAVSPVFIFMFL